MKNEIRLDGRVSPECLYEKRKQVVALYRKGIRLNVISETVGLCWKAVRKVFLVMDNLKVHHCKPVKEWLEKNEEQIEVFYLPSYSPELNPDERLNAALKNAITTSVPRRTRDGLLKKTREHMDMVTSSPERVKTYFWDRHVAYAAEST